MASHRGKAEAFEQTLLTRYPKSEIKRLVITEDQITEIKLKGFSPSGGSSQPIGLSAGYDPKGNLELFAICDSSICLVVKVNTSANELDRAKRAALLQKYVFCRDAGEIFGFDLDAAAVAMLHVLNVHIARGVDIQTVLADQITPERIPLDCLKCCIGDDVACKKIGLSANNVKGAFKHEYRDEKDLALDEPHFIAVTHRAWAAQFVATYQNAAFTFSDVKYIETINFSAQLMTVIIDMLETTRRVTNIGPKGGDHRFTKAQSEEDAQVSIHMESFAQRFQGGEEVILVQLNTIGERITRSAVVSSVNGKNATFEFPSGQRVTIANNDKSLVSVKSITRSGLTNADKKTRSRIRAVLLGNLELFADNIWVHNILIACTVADVKPWPDVWSSATTPILPDHLKHPSRMSLNRSQKHVVDAMLDPLKPITIVQGPPGTGKTSTLAAFVKVALAVGRSGIWLIAQSNVAVKNIAEKLVKVGFTNFKLLVSNDFELWHDHLYTALAPCIIRSTAFRLIQRREFATTEVFIATLSMLSSRFIGKFTSVVPIRTLVVDEASQIKVSEYINVFTSFKDTLQKMCFIGDPKQLPPYGADDVQQVQSIFELEHLKDICLLLDTQYRMPPQLGAFISKEVYDNKLLSWDAHPVQPDTPALFFIDVPTGGERQNEKKSFENTAEAEIAIQLATIFQHAGHNHRIITPYAGQTELIENLLKKRDLEWDDKCFNVDSFQGNEDDYIIISLVRSQAIGFLSSLRRTNVMLSRCKKAMYVISSRKFLGKKGLDTLVGRLASGVDGGAWLSVDHVAQGKIDKYVAV